jgi:hypothetical protein
MPLSRKPWSKKERGRQSEMLRRGVRVEDCSVVVEDEVVASGVEDVEGSWATDPSVGRSLKGVVPLVCIWNSVWFVTSY